MTVNTRVLLLTSSNLGPYHQARYRSLAQGNICLIVVKTPVEEYHRPWEAGGGPDDFRTLAPFRLEDSFLQIYRKCKNMLAQERAEVVVCVGYNSRYIWALAAACKFHKVPCALYLVGWQQERPRSRHKEALKRVFIREAFRAALATGALAGEYARNLGVPAGSIYTVSNVVDNAHFSHGTRSAAARSDDLPARFFLTVSRLSPEKNITGLLQAFERYRAQGGSWELCIAGTGPQEAELQAQEPGAIAGSLHWLGWLGYDQLPIVYQACHCFILPSEIEPWGLVVNEAMAAGKPVLVSRQCGCHPELCQVGRNGYLFDSHDTLRLADLMHHVESFPDSELERMGQASREIIAGYTLETWRDAFIGAIQDLAQ